MKTLVVVSGSDAPGINALLYHLCELITVSGDTMIGALGGFRALLDEQFVTLTPSLIVPYIGLGGSYLPSSRDPVLSEESNHQMLHEVIFHHKVDHVVLCGGNDSLHHLPPILQDVGIACVGIPTTIDNDVAGTDRSLGFDSACQYAYQAIDAVRATGHALTGRFFAVETLGGNTGILTLEIARGAGADAVIVPEYPITDDAPFVNRLKSAVRRKGHALLVYTESVPNKERILASLAQKVGIPLCETRLGHAQRGGVPSHADRVLAREWAHLAFGALKQGAASSITVYRDGSPTLRHGLLLDDPKPMPNRALYNEINGLT